MSISNLGKLKRLIEEEIGHQYRSGDVLKDAIADAKAVRETALANARLRMEEAFTPRLQSIIGRSVIPGNIGGCGTSGAVGISGQIGFAGTSRIFEIPQMK